MRDPSDVLKDYEEARDHADDTLEAETGFVMNELQTRLQKCDNPLDRSSNYSACQEVLCRIADDNDDAEGVIALVEEWSSDIAQKCQIKKDDVKENTTLQLRELRREQNQERLENAVEKPTLDRGVGIDEYVEQHLDFVVKLDTLDHVSDPVLIFEFDDGTSVEFEDGDQRNFNEFYDKISRGVDGVQIKDKIASLQLREEIDGDIFEDNYAEEQYRKLSYGPEGRAWGLDWNEVITDLEENERAEFTRVAGPRTDAFELLQSKIRDGRAARDKQSVVDAGNGSMFYCEDYEEDELWIPTTMIDNACADFATSRSGFIHELDARGVTTDEISGTGCAVADKTVNPPTRFWRLKADHVDVPDVDVVDALDTDVNPFADSEGGSSTEFSGAAGGLD